MAIKIDLEKAYNRVRWDFRVAGILECIRKVIISAISNTSMEILWNGVPSHKFNPAKGIRQVVLYMKWMGHCIHDSISSGKWSPIRLSRT